MSIDQQELAKLQNGNLVYGTYEEVEQHAEDTDTCVDRYFDHVNPSNVQKYFQYIGSGADLYQAAKPIYLKDENNNFLGMREFKEKF
jgi:hypothetical protein